MSATANQIDDTNGAADSTRKRATSDSPAKISQNQRSSSGPAEPAANSAGSDNTSRKRATSNSSSKNSKNRRSSDATWSASSGSDPANRSNRATSNPPSRYGTGSGSDRVNSKRATSNPSSKNSQNQRSTPPDIPDHPAGKTWTVPELLKRATQHFHPKPPKKRKGLSKDFFDRPSTKAWLAWYDKLMYEPIRRAEAYICKEEEKIRAEVRSRNLRWRLDAIDEEFNRIHKEIDTIVKVVMRSYGCHPHRGEWRRNHCGRNKRLEQNTLIKNDLLRARHLAQYGPARPLFFWDFYLHPESRTAQGSATCQLASSSTAPPQVAQTVSLRPDVSAADSPPSTTSVPPPRPTAPPRVAQPVRLRPDLHPPDPTASPSAARECSAFSQTRPNSFFTAAAPPQTATSAPPFSVPYWTQLPYNPPLNPLFARAMDGTTFLVPRPDPPERPEFAPYVRPKRKRKPSERQVRKLYEVALAGPPPDENAGRYTDARIMLFEIGATAWQRYGAYFYDFFKRRILDRAPKSNKSATPKPPDPASVNTAESRGSRAPRKKECSKESKTKKRSGSADSRSQAPPS